MTEPVPIPVQQSATMTPLLLPPASGAMDREPSNLPGTGYAVPHPSYYGGAASMPIMSECVARPVARGQDKISLIITESVKKKIQEGKFVEMGEMLLKNEEQLSQASAFLHAVGIAEASGSEAKVSKIKDAGTWAKAFAKFKYFHSQFYPLESRALDAYMYHVLDLAGDGADWELFDTEFRRERASATDKRAWDDYHNYLYNRAFSKASRGVQPFRGKGGNAWGRYPPYSGNPRRGRNQADSIPPDYCKLHHSGKGCNFGTMCRYDHACPKCKQDHPLRNHPRPDPTNKKKSH